MHISRLSTICIKTILLLLLSSLLSCHNRKEKDPMHYFDAIAANDIKMGKPQEGEWLFRHKEKGQTFEAYKKCRLVKPTQHKSVIYLLPVGDFTELQQKALQATRQYTAIFFQLKTVLLPPISDKTVPSFAMRQEEDGHMQLLAPYLLDSLLKGKIPQDGIALHAISAKDLYPKNDWNYVFGLASYVDSVGITSIYRLQNQQLDTANFKLCLRRLMKVTSHEIGHILSLRHCIYAKCRMNGTNSLDETDQTPARLCSECQRKLFYNIGYDNVQRLKQLIHFCQNNGLESDAAVFKTDLDAIE
ncbi:archaemetzincin [Chitinophaga sp. HK235]|uniref:archaemetzincin n=1 Tax=Chitinophaga sp. HK235 TaxID=2952571 RepID=UPI001BA8084A|nr:archaemetzincin [Chitinophaga sp. HK235]